MDAREIEQIKKTMEKNKQLIAVLNESTRQKLLASEEKRKKTNENLIRIRKAYEFINQK